MDSLGTDFDLLLTRCALCALVVAGLWACLVVGAAAAEARTRGRISLTARTGCPHAVRVWLVGAFVALFAGVAPAHAGDADSGSTISSALDGLPLPDRALGSPARRPSTHEVVVRPGDSLWRILEHRSGPEATDSTIAAGVARLYAANRSTIGPSPDLLVPGQRLTIDFPAPTTHQEEP